MSEGLPKIVLERLRMAEPGGHPDADLLTAFAERTLLPRERDAVLQHLAQAAQDASSKGDASHILKAKPAPVAS